MGQETQNANNHLDAVYEIFHAGNGGSLPTTMELDAWIATYGVYNTTLRAKVAEEALSALQQRECTYLVETAAMTVVWKSCTCTSGACQPSIVPGLQELATALGD